MLVLRSLAGVAFQVALFAAGLFLPAGTWQWPRATQFLVAYAIVVSAAVLVLARVAPAGLEARFETPDRSQPVADRVASALLLVSMVAWWIFIPIDVFRLRLLPPPSLLVSGVGAAVSLAGLAIILLTHYQNAFLAPVVKDQSERGQVLVDTGLYGCIRHPMYSGTLLWFAGLALWLESSASAVATLALLPSLWARIRVEERTLQKALNGYTEYMDQVPARLVPYVW
jgi:protein-S-isoprenylcysteine O-methyltransferase Ste14